MYELSNVRDVLKLTFCHFRRLYKNTEWVPSMSTNYVTISFVFFLSLDIYIHGTSGPPFWKEIANTNFWSLNLFTYKWFLKLYWHLLFQSTFLFLLKVKVTLRYYRNEFGTYSALKVCQNHDLQNYLKTWDNPQIENSNSMKSIFKHVYDSVVREICHYMQC